MLANAIETKPGSVSPPQAQRLETLGRMAVGIAHDFNNLLAVILGHASLVAEELPTGSPARELMSGLEMAAVQAAQLATQLLSFARQQALPTQLVDLNKALRETGLLLRQALGPRVECIVRPGPQLPLIRVEPSQLTQVLLNLCLNARDAMPNGGSITLCTEAMAVDLASLSEHPNGRLGTFVRLRVSDTGLGIPPEVRECVFEPFFTTKSPGQGTGLGLATVQRIVEQCQGWIECTSEVGRGTCFDVYFPAA
jgi:signal transduction histidine kinase